MLKFVGHTFVPLWNYFGHFTPKFISLYSCCTDIWIQHVSRSVALHQEHHREIELTNREWASSTLESYSISAVDGLSTEKIFATKVFNSLATNLSKRRTLSRKIYRNCLKSIWHSYCSLSWIQRFVIWLKLVIKYQTYTV